MICLVTGDRNYLYPSIIYNVLKEYRDNRGLKRIIAGGAHGADRQAANAAKKLGIEVVEVFADWEKYGKGAGMRRNSEMLTYKPDVVLVFHEDLSSSKGTKDMVNKATARGFEVIYIKRGE